VNETLPEFTPVTLLTGFLGSGKTTLLGRLLKDPALSDTAVIINEFGEVGIDHNLVERLDDDVAILSSGCLCCTVRTELAATLRDLHSRRARGSTPPFRRIMIESTGLADPFPVLATLSADPVLRHHFSAAGVVATIDAVNGFAQLDRHLESVRQAAIADLLVLTKTDLATETEVSQLTRRLLSINPTAPLVRSAEEQVDASVVMAPRASSFRATVEPTGPTVHSDVQAFSIVVEEPIAWAAFGVWLTMLLNRHGEKILRVKGILALQDEERPVAVHGVQRLVHAPTHLNRWPEGDRRSRLVFIVEGIDPEAIRRSFATFNSLSTFGPAATARERGQGTGH
jgi:G3E family GTPase